VGRKGGRGARRRHEEAVLVQGFVVSFECPSRAVLFDWARRTAEDIRSELGEDDVPEDVRRALDELSVKEVVGLVPPEIVTELERIRRSFYYTLEQTCLRLWGMWLLPTANVPKFKEKVEAVREDLKALDKRIEEALKGPYYRAVEYYMSRRGKRPKQIPRLAERLKVNLIPLRISTVLMKELAREFFEEEMKRQEEAYRRQKARLEEELSALDKLIEERRRALDEAKRRVKELEERLRELTGKDPRALEAEIERLRAEKARIEESIKALREEEKLMLDIATLRDERDFLRAKIKELRQRKADLERELSRLTRDYERRAGALAGSYGFVEESMERTTRSIVLDASEMVRSGLKEEAEELRRILEEKPRGARKAIRALLERLRSWRNTIASSMPNSRWLRAVEELMQIAEEAYRGKAEEALDKLREWK